MEVLINKKENWNEADIVREIERVLNDYYKDAEGRKYYLEADGDTLKQIYCDDEFGNDTIEWGIATTTFDGVANKYRVTLTA